MYEIKYKFNVDVLKDLFCWSVSEFKIFLFLNNGHLFDCNPCSALQLNGVKVTFLLAIIFEIRFLLFFSLVFMTENLGIPVIKNAKF